MTYDDLLAKFPECGIDVWLAYNSNTDCVFSVNVEPLAQWAQKVRELGELFHDDEEEQRRVQKIMDAIAASGKQYPIFVSTELENYIEGNHRLVAFQRLGLPAVTVIRIV